MVKYFVGRDPISAECTLQEGILVNVILPGSHINQLIFDRICDEGVLNILASGNHIGKSDQRCEVRVNTIHLVLGITFSSLLVRLR